MILAVRICTTALPIVGWGVRTVSTVKGWSLEVRTRAFMVSGSLFVSAIVMVVEVKQKNTGIELWRLMNMRKIEK